MCLDTRQEPERPWHVRFFFLSTPRGSVTWREFGTSPCEGKRWRLCSLLEALHELPQSWCEAKIRLRTMTGRQSAGKALATAAGKAWATVHGFLTWNRKWIWTAFTAKKGQSVKAQHLVSYRNEQIYVRRWLSLLFRGPDALLPLVFAQLPWQPAAYEGQIYNIGDRATESPCMSQETLAWDPYYCSPLPVVLWELGNRGSKRLIEVQIHDMFPRGCNSQADGCCGDAAVCGVTQASLRNPSPVFCNRAQQTHWSRHTRLR